MFPSSTVDRVEDASERLDLESVQSAQAGSSFVQCRFDDQEVCKMVIVGLQELDKFAGAWAQFDPTGKEDSMHLSIKSSGITVDKFALNKETELPHGSVLYPLKFIGFYRENTSFLRVACSHVTELHL